MSGIKPFNIVSSFSRTMDDSTRCRTCLLKSDELKSMFVQWMDSITIWNMYEYLMNIGDNVDDEAMVLICIKCEENLRSAYLFKLMCEKTEKTLTEFVRIEEPILLKSDNESETDCNNFEDNYTTDILEAEVYQICGNDQDGWIKSLDDNVNQIKANDENEQNIGSQLVEPKILGRKCKFCNVQFESIKLYQAHYRQVHNQSVPKVLCSYCGKLVRKHSIDKHLNSHSSIKIRNHLCTICGSSFTLIENLTKHLRIHSNDKRYLPCCYGSSINITS